MSIRSEKIWKDGELIDYDAATTHVLSHTLHYGLGAFEGIRAYEQPDGSAGIWELDEHLQRFLDTLKILQMKMPYDLAALRQACIDVLQANGFRSAYLRPLAFFGEGQMGLGARDNKVHIVIAAWPWGAYLGEEGMQKGVRLRTSSFSRHHPNAAMSRAKVVGHYVNSILARYEANDDGFDEGLMLDANGYVAEGTGENVFVVKNGVVLTPPTANILPGITRDTCIRILEHLGVQVKEQFFGRDAFYTADEAFMCGTAAEVTPIASLDRRQIGAGCRGPLTEKVQRIYLDAVQGKVPWLAESIFRIGIEASEPAE
jgi:branched-chain amino acid aminotransferase